MEVLQLSGTLFVPASTITDQSHTCPVGSVAVDSGRRVPCPPGTHHSSEEETREKCAPGHHTEREAEPECTQCPETQGRSGATKTEGSTKLSQDTTFDEVRLFIIIIIITNITNPPGLSMKKASKLTWLVTVSISPQIQRPLCQDARMKETTIQMLAVNYHCTNPFCYYISLH